MPLPRCPIALLRERRSERERFARDAVGTGSRLRFEQPPSGRRHPALPIASLPLDRASASTVQAVCRANWSGSLEQNGPPSASMYVTTKGGTAMRGPLPCALSIAAMGAALCLAVCCWTYFPLDGYRAGGMLKSYPGMTSAETAALAAAMHSSRRPAPPPRRLTPEEQAVVAALAAQEPCPGRARACLKSRLREERATLESLRRSLRGTADGGHTAPRPPTNKEGPPR